MVFLIFILFLVLRVIPYLSNSVPLGYDPGIYLYTFKKYSEVGFLSFSKLTDWIVIGLEPGLMAVSRILSIFISPEAYLIPLVIFFCLLLLLAFYLFNKQLWGKGAALWVALFMSTSAIQYKAYWYYYIKQIAASGFLFLTLFYALKKSKWAIPFSVLVFYFHRPTAALLFGVLFLMVIFEKEGRRYFMGLLVTTLVLAGFYYAPTYQLTVFPLVVPILTGFVPKVLGGRMGFPSGSFFDIKEALLLTLPYLPFFVYGIKKEGMKKKSFLAFFPLFITFVIVIFKFFFYRRFIIFLDLFIISFAGSGAYKFFLSMKRTNLRAILQVAYVLFLISFISTFVYLSAKPLILEDEFNEVQKFREVERDAYILVTDQQYTPWVYGWSERGTIAPGYGEYDIYWTNEDWNTFWLSGDREKEKELLLRLPKPLYIYSGDRRRLTNYDLGGECFERVNFRTYKFICDN